MSTKTGGLTALLKPRLLFAAVLAAYAVFYGLIVPGMVVTNQDDFGYYESIVSTLATGRLTTGEWLGPYSVVPTVLGALAYLATGNFYVATFGVLALFSLLSFLLLFVLLKTRTSAPIASVVSFLFCTFPIYMGKSVEYTSAVPTFALFLLAVLLFEKGRTALFFLAAFLALITRQNSAVLLVLPLYAPLAQRVDGRGDTIRLALYFAAYLLASYLVISGLNVTYAQANVVNKVFEEADAAAMLRSLSTGLFVYVMLLSFFNAALGGDLPELLKRNLKIFPLPIVLTAALFVHLHYARHLMLSETGFTYKFLPYAIAASFWTMDWRLLKPSPLNVLALAYIAVASLRGIWWDYYFMEPAAIALLLAARPRGGRLRFFSPAALAMAAVLLLNLFAGYRLKVALDLIELNNVVYEQIERAGAINVADMSGATLGMLGWKLFNYYIENEGRDFTDLTGFLGYVKAGGVVVESQTPWSKEPRPLGQSGGPSLKSPWQHVVLYGSYRIGFMDLKYRAVDMGVRAYTVSKLGGPLMRIDRRKYKRRPFPLTNAEWSEFIENERNRRG